MADPSLARPVIANMRQKAWKSRAEELCLTDAAMVCLIGPTLPPQSQMGSIIHLAAKNKIRLCTVEKKVGKMSKVCAYIVLLNS